ncbi:biopolymer transporter ExbD [uncultured Azohydromonas sp.]|jgi:Biopolymer transport protein|uniref:ExbD/TolR family protein n=1 Tax=uncultured Azohydromonas sp. TaxID=487342 RepID=UPI00260913B1|nr:biopolymer transporter ExbD [uncultured Azohydromonas sp.]
MAMGVAPQDGGDEDAVIASINTTPLVDVMLVLLIIFLITVPVVTASIKLELPKERNQPTQTKPENVVLAVDRDGALYWGLEPLSVAELQARLRAVAARDPQPEVHIRGDMAARYEAVGRLVAVCQKVGIRKVGFITEPTPTGGR